MLEQGGPPLGGGEPPPPDGKEQGRPDVSSKPPEPTPQMFNLVPALLAQKDGEEWLRKQAKKALEDYERDLKSSEGYRERCARDIDLLFGRGGTMKGAAEGEPKPCLPIFAKILLRIVARVLSLATTTEPIPVPTNDEDNDRAERVALHISWEKRAKHPDWASAMFATILQWAAFGSAFRWVDWDPIKKRKNIEPLSISELILPYSYKDHSLRLENVPHFTRLRRLPRHKIEQLGDAGHYHEVDRLWDEGNDQGVKAKTIVLSEGEPALDPVRDIVVEQEGVTPDGTQKSDLYAILEKHYWARLPGEKRSKRIALTYEKTTRIVLRVVIMEEEDRLDRLRYDNEVRENQIQAENLAAEAAMAGQPPPPPKQPAPVLTTPVFPPIHYKFWENPEGIYGLGVGVFVSQLNEIANNLMGENIVAERLANVVGGLMSNDMGLEKGELQLKYGKFMSVDVPHGELEGSFLPFQFQRPKGNIMQIIDSIDESCQTVMSSSDYQSGMPGPSHETAAAAKIRSREGAQAIDAAMEMFLLPLAAEYREYARLNAAFMPEAEYFYVTEPDPMNPGKANRVRKEIGRADYQVDYDMTFTADARMALDPGVGVSAIQAYQILLADPIASGNPNIILKALKKVLKALKASDLAALLPDKIPEPPPPSPMSQVDENAGFLTEQDHPVLPDDDDVNHLNDMEEFEGTGQADQLTPTGKQLFERHRQAHRAQAYQKGKAIQQEEATGGGLAESIPRPQAGMA